MNKKQIIIGTLIFLIGLISGNLIINISSNINKSTTKEKQIIKEEKTKYQDKENYTLEELYEIVENPEQFYQLNDPKMSNYNKIMFHFYDYFDKDTKVKVTSSTQKRNGKVEKVLQTEYIDYDEYNNRMKEAYEYEKREEQEFKTNNEEEIYDYRIFVRELIYGLK